MDKNPFSLYDFMGYLFPGCLSLIIFGYFYRLDFNIYEICDVDNFIMLINTGKTITLENILLIVVIGYAIGHIIAYLSAVTIEILFTNKVFGYPSKYLLEDESRNLKRMLIDYFASDSNSKNKCLSRLIVILKVLVKFCVLIIILPIPSMVMSLGTITGINQFIVRPLDKYLRTSLRQKQYKLAEKLKISHPDVNDNDCDYHRIVMHYVYLDVPQSQRKTDNYLAIYGFLRSLCFIICLAFEFLLILSISTWDICADFDIQIVFVVFALFLAAYILYLGFVKFYRRFTLENLMTLLVGLPDDSNSSKSL